MATELFPNVDIQAEVFANNPVTKARAAAEKALTPAVFGMIEDGSMTGVSRVFLEKHAGILMGLLRAYEQSQLAYERSREIHTLRKILEITDSQPTQPIKPVRA